MFILRRTLTPLLPNISKNLVCFVHQRNKNPDPGINRRKKILDVEADEMDDLDLDEFESDFMQVHKSHKEHLHEMRLRKEKEQYQIVGQKYFKEKFPNFLTWHDKEQIRHLHRTNPEEWTIERLSESFPALPHVIKSVIKAGWTKTQPHKITNHDRSVQKNWELFKSGQIKHLPPELAQHLNKFTSRALNFSPFAASPSDSQKPEIQAKKQVPVVFSDIISSYEELKNRNNNNNNNNNDKKKEEPPHINLDRTMPSKEPPPGDTYLTKTLSRTKKTVTLSEFRVNLLEKAERGSETMDLDDRLIISSTIEENSESSPETERNAATAQTRSLESEIQPEKYNKAPSSGAKTGSVTFKSKGDKSLAHLVYPERITIPYKLRKKGCIYKLDDCYYDDDGEFLYRVPGMG